MATQLRQMQEVNFPLVGGFNENLRSQVSPENTYNMYVSIPSDAKQPPSLLPTPGMRPIQTFINNGIGRAQFTFKTAKYMYCVVGSYVYQVNLTLNINPIGILGSDSGYVGITANNNNQIIFVDGAGGWVFNETTDIWTDISEVLNFPRGCKSIGYLDGYAMAFYPNSPQFGLSEINDFLIWPLENIGSMERKADIGVAVGVVKGLIFFMGTTSIETWFNAGAPLLPISRDNNALFEYGCAAVGSVVEGFDTLFWLGRDSNGVGGIMMSNGGQPIKISSYEIETKIATISDVSDATGQVFKKDGHIFYQLSFTKGNITILFDYTTWEKTYGKIQDLSMSWSLLGFSDFDEKEQSNGSRHLMQSHAFFNNIHYALSYNNAKLYELDSTYHKYDDKNILRMRITHRFIHPTLKLLKVSSIGLLFIRGVGLQNGTDANPYVEMQVSFDGGQNWTKPRQAFLGKIGKSIGKTVFYECGISESFVFMFKCWNAVDIVLMGGAMKYDVIGP